MKSLYEYEIGEEVYIVKHSDKGGVRWLPSKHERLGKKGIVVNRGFYNHEPVYKIGFRPVAPMTRPVELNFHQESLSRYPRLESLPSPPALNENTNMGIKIEKPTLVNGKDITSMSQDELLRALRAAEEELQELRSYKSRPKALVKMIEDTEAAIAELIALSDAKFDGTEQRING